MNTITATASRSFLSTEVLRSKCPAVFAEAPAAEVSKKYAFVPTYSIVEKLQEYGFRPVDAISGISKSNGKTGKLINSETGAHVLRFEPEAQSREFTHKEGRVQLVVVNSHDTSKQLSISAGFFRLVCSNGLVAMDTKVSVRARHILADAGELNAGIYAKIEDAITKAGKLSEIIDAMRERKLKPIELARFSKKAMEIRWPDADVRKVSPKALLEARRPEDEGSDVWRVFNRVQENIVRGGVRSEGSPMPTFPLTRPRQTFDVNARLWDLATSFVN